MTERRLMTERRADLACRQNCPFTRSRTHLGLRPCADEARNKQKLCLDQINSHFADRGVKPVELNILEKRIEIMNNSERIAVVANGVAVFLKSQS